MVSATVSRTVTALSRTGAEVTAALEVGAAGAFVIPPRHSTAVIRIIAKALPYIFCSSGGQLTLCVALTHALTRDIPQAFS